MTGDGELEFAPLGHGHRERVESILQSVGVFNLREIEVALELFDETFGDSSPAESDYTFMGAFTRDGELAGYACYGPTPGTDRTFDLYWIATDSALQGMGVGTALMREVEAQLAQQRARLLVVETSARTDYAPTRDFYGRLGYSEAGRVREFYAPGDDRVIFTKRLNLSPGSAGEGDEQQYE
ncbi:MAG: GNAT family N-acetyltransferase [Gemmatimonadaceae bacterium]